MILFNNVVDILALTNFHSSIIIHVELINACFIRTTFVDIDKTWLTISTDGFIEEA
jgi:hypothetical protein